MLKKLSQSVRGCTRIVLSYKQLKNKNVHSAYLLRVNGGGGGQYAEEIFDFHLYININQFISMFFDKKDEDEENWNFGQT